MEPYWQPNTMPRGGEQKMKKMQFLSSDDRHYTRGGRPGNT
jgi:hypothetical protein